MGGPVFEVLTSTDLATWNERFAIDPPPLLDVDGTWYLCFARDVLEPTGSALHRPPDLDRRRPGDPWPELGGAAPPT